MNRPVLEEEDMRKFVIHGVKAGLAASVLSGGALMALQRYTTVLRSFSPSARLATVICT